MFKKIRPFSSARRFLLTLYIFLVILGVIVTLLYLVVPSLSACPTMFGLRICAPLGIYVILFSSIPGYMIAGNFFSYYPDIPWYVSFLIVLVVSFIFYYAVGLFIDKLRDKDSEKRNVVVIIGSFVIFLVVFLLLALQLRIIK